MRTPEVRNERGVALAMAVFALVVIGALVYLAWRPLRKLGREVLVERARESFRLQRERLEAKFIDAAAASGKPRGLSWKECNFASRVELARDRQTGQLIALVPVTIAFEAVAGGPMEGVAGFAELEAWMKGRAQ